MILKKILTLYKIPYSLNLIYKQAFVAVYEYNIKYKMLLVKYYFIKKYKKISIIL